MRFVSCSFTLALFLPWAGDLRSAPVTIAPAAPRLAVAWNGPLGSSGLLASMTTESPWEFVTAPLEIGRNAVLSFARDRLYAVSRPAGTITIVRPDSWSIERVHSLGEGSEPLDIAVVSAEKAYVTRATANHLLRLNLVSGASEDVVDLSAFADRDGVADLGRMILHEGRLFVQIRRINFDEPGVFAPPAYLAVIDVASETLIDVDPGTPGIQAIQLMGTWPKLRMQIVPESRRLFLSATGTSFDAGGIEVIDLDALASTGLMIQERAGFTGADLGPFVMVTPERGYLVYTTDFTISSHMQGFSELGGVDPLPQVYGVVDYFAPALEWNPQTGTFFFPSSGSGGDGIRVFDVDTDAQLTRDPIPTTGPPTDFLLYTDTAARFVRGDANVSGEIDISDAIFILIYLFGGVPEVTCLDAADVDDVEEVDLSDAIYLLMSLFKNGPGPAEPLDCGTDPSLDDLTCTSFSACSE